MTTSAEPKVEPKPKTKPLFTRSNDRVIAGVAGGIAQRLDADPLVVRAVFGVLTLANGVGVVIYALAWLATKDDETSDPVTPREFSPRATGGIACLALGVLLEMQGFGLVVPAPLFWPLALAGVGSAVLWSRNNQSDGNSAELRPGSSRVWSMFDSSISPLRLLIGGVLVVLGLGAFIASNTSFAAAGSVFIALLAASAGAVLIVGPFLLRVTQQMLDERRRRIRSDERAEMAAHLHDSVLHTLALIQRADASNEVTSLARRQERELRAWLRGRTADTTESLSAAIDDLASTVEQELNTTVEAVVVGDCVVDDRVRSLVLAAKEATVNAARHSGASKVALFVEVEPKQISAYIRDEGHGFDRNNIDPDRRGISESIEGRMRRNGGTAAITTTPGEGTDVALHLPLDERS